LDFGRGEFAFAPAAFALAVAEYVCIGMVTIDAVHKK
jgi:hypothetical protein